MSLPSNAFHGEFSSADATALDEPTSRIKLYKAGGTAALTLDPQDFVEVHSITIASAATNATVSVYDGIDNTVDAGELVGKAVVPTSTTVSLYYGDTPHVCQKGEYPKVKASAAGQVDVVIHGKIVRQTA